MCRLSNFADIVLSFNCSTFHKTSLGNYFSIFVNKHIAEHRIPSLLFLWKQHDILFSVWLSYHTSFFNIYLFNNKTCFMFSSQLSFIAIIILVKAKSTSFFNVAFYIKIFDSWCSPVFWVRWFCVEKIVYLMNMML